MINAEPMAQTMRPGRHRLPVGAVSSAQPGHRLSHEFEQLTHLIAIQRGWRRTVRRSLSFGLTRFCSPQKE